MNSVQEERNREADLIIGSITRLSIRAASITRSITITTRINPVRSPRNIIITGGILVPPLNLQTNLPLLSLNSLDHLISVIILLRKEMLKIKKSVITVLSEKENNHLLTKSNVYLLLKNKMTKEFRHCKKR